MSFGPNYGPFGPYDPTRNRFGSSQQSQRDVLFSAQDVQSTAPFSLFGVKPVYPFGVLPITKLSLFGEPTRRQYSSIHKGFDECLTRIELDSTRIQLAKQHYNAVKNWLQSHLNVEVRRVGSFRKHTKIRPRIVNGKSSPIDIDARVCFGDATHIAPSGRGITGEGLLQLLRNGLIENKTYRLMAPSIDRPAVTVSYADEFSIELTPCMRNQITPDNWRSPANYLLWNSSGNLEIADYDYDCAFITELNKLHDGYLIPAMKLLKQFVRNKSIELKSFQVELLCIKVISPFLSKVKEDGGTWEWQDLIVCFLEDAPVVLELDLSLYGSRTTPARIPNAIQIQKDLRFWSILALRIREFGDTPEAFELWRAFYGEPFPAN